MRYAVFRIPKNRTLTKGGWDDFFFWSDDLADALKVVERDPVAEVYRAFVGFSRHHDDPAYQIVDLETGDVILDTGKNYD